VYKIHIFRNQRNFTNTINSFFYQRYVLRLELPLIADVCRPSQFRSFTPISKTYLLLRKNFPFLFFSPDVKANKNTSLPWSPYQIILRINDTSLQPGHGTSYVSSFLCELVLKTELEPCTKAPHSKLNVNIEFPVSVAFHSSKVPIVPTVEQD